MKIQDLWQKSSIDPTFHLNLEVGYTTSRSKGYRFGESSWMNSWVDYYGSYETRRTIAGVTFTYKRTKTSSDFTIAGMWALITINHSVFIWLYRLKVAY